ncbi:sensor histidine kinase [Hymenobacter sp. J193]|uniref:sensor histidine kinase n=1 Tax=Hymenobacter sp. J193 TaxID=2898429 RepID=UPI0021518C23|nr:sensor histidine kinase [Hymenobacter sp. J193]MCR5886395.1 sensor histidine kinase [Hymenobacter sp. J193]
MARLITKQHLTHLLIHVGVWAGLLFLPWMLLASSSGPTPHFNLGRTLWPATKMALLFYVNYWVLIPKLLARRRFAAYFAAVVALLFICTLPMSAHWVGIGSTPPPRPGLTVADQHRFRAVILLVNVLVWLVSSGLRITGEWFENERQRRQMQSDKLEAELAFLKSQVSPHFLFNTLNNIYSLAQLKSDDAPEAILKLSHLMRYMLYEADTPRVALAKEVEYVQNYVDLQRLRLDEDVLISFHQEGQLAGRLIEPMLLIPFVENAFKHGVSYRHPSAIRMELHVTTTELRFRVHNRRFPQAPRPDQPRDSGVGLHNVEQRLALLYPGRHELRIEPTADDFTITLTLALPHAPLPLS